MKKNCMLIDFKKSKEVFSEEKRFAGIKTDIDEIFQ